MVGLVKAVPAPTRRSSDPAGPRRRRGERGPRRRSLRVVAGSWILGVALVAGCGMEATEDPAPTVSQAPAPAVATSQPTHTPETAAATQQATTEAITTAQTPAEAPAARGEVVRVVGVVDGDTLRVSVGGVTERLRIIGIDAPELSDGECYAQASASRMQSLVQSRDVRIVADPTQDDRDRYDRILRHVFTLDGVNVAQRLVAEGLAREYTYDRPYAGRDDYLEAQEIARAGDLGIWSGACDVAAQPASTPTAAAPFAPQPAPGADAGKCVIKGNISSSGEKIYHVPGGRSYDETIITESKGERWFCTEQEAVDAGWRKAKR